MLKAMSCSLILFICLLGISNSAQRVIKSSDLLFRAEVIDLNYEWGPDSGSSVLSSKWAFNGLKATVLDYEVAQGNVLDDELRRYLESNKHNFYLKFDRRITKDSEYFESLKRYKKTFGGVQDDLVITGKLRLSKSRVAVDSGMNGVKIETAFNAKIITSQRLSNEEKFTIEGSWSVMSERSLTVPFEANLLRAYRGVCRNGYKMYTVPNYQSCFKTMVIDLSQWEEPNDKAIGDWINSRKNKFKTSIKGVWQHNDNYNQLQLYRNATTSNFRGKVKVSGVLTLKISNLRNGSSLVESIAQLDSVRGPSDIVDTKIEVVRVSADVTKIFNSIRDVYGEQPSKIKVAVKAKTRRAPRGMIISEEFEKYLKEQVFVETHVCNLESFPSAIDAVKAHKGGLFGDVIKGKVEVLFDLEHITNRLADGSNRDEFRYYLRAVKGPILSIHESKFAEEHSHKMAQKIINFHTLYEDESY